MAGAPTDTPAIATGTELDHVHPEPIQTPSETGLPPISLRLRARAGVKRSAAWTRQFFSKFWSDTKALGVIWIWPALPSVVVAVIGFIAIYKFASLHLPIYVPIWIPEEVAVAEATSRLLVGASLLFLVVATCAALIVSIWIIWRNTPGVRCFYTFCLSVLLVPAIAFFVEQGCPGTGACPQFHQYLGEDVFAVTLEAYGDVHLTFLRGIIDVGNACAILVGTFAAGAVTALSPEQADQQTPDAAAAQIVKKLESLKYQLFAGAIVLFAGILQMKIWRDWPIAFMPNDKDAYSAIAAATVNIQGFHAVLILAAIVLPAAIRLRLALNELYDSATSQGVTKDRQTWITEHGLNLKFSEYVPRILALIAPFLAGPVADGIKKVSDLLM